MSIIDVLAFWFVPSILILWLGGLSLALGDFYEFEDVLSTRKEFLRCLFQFPLFAWEMSQYYVNNAGRVIVTVLVSVITLECTCMILATLIVLEILRLIICAFLLAFRKEK